MSTLRIHLTGSGSSAAEVLIARILGFAGAKGIDQATLAARAGISPESLSRLKKAGSCRLATALDLARAAGLTALDLTDQPAGKVAASMAAGKLSAGRRFPVSAEELVSALSRGEPREEFRAHLCGFFEELPIEAVHDVVLDENLDYTHLVSLAKALGAEGETLDWLAEMAGHGVASAA